MRFVNTLNIGQQLFIFLIIVEMKMTANMNAGARKIGETNAGIAKRNDRKYTGLNMALEKPIRMFLLSFPHFSRKNSTVLPYHLFCL